MARATPNPPQPAVEPEEPLEVLPLPPRVARPLGYPRVFTLPEKRQRGLRAFWMDGLFGSLAASFADPYYTLYLLSLHANNAQIGLVNTLSQLISAALALPGAAQADRTGRYHRQALFTSVASRAVWLIMLAAPLLPGVQAKIWAVILGWTLLTGFSAYGNAAWTALSADLVPPRLRGGYFASRNIVMQLVRLVSIPLAGQLINLIGEPLGYQVNLGVAFVVGLIAMYFFRQLPEHRRPPSAADGFTTREALRRIRRLPTLRNFMAAHAVLTLGVMIGSPFINVYLAEDVGMDVGAIGLSTTFSVLASLIGMRVLGRVHDRRGITRTMRWGLYVPFITISYFWVHGPWSAYLVSALGAFSWAGYNLGAFNLLLAASPNEHRPHYIAIHGTVTALVGAIGPIVGGALLDAVGYYPVFALSTAVRLAGFVLFFLLVREPEPAAEPEEEGE